MSYFHWKYNQLSSAIRRFTVLFGMGRSGTTSLWSSGKGFVFTKKTNSFLDGNEAQIVSSHQLLKFSFDISDKKASRL